MGLLGWNFWFDPWHPWHLSGGTVRFTQTPEVLSCGTEKELDTPKSNCGQKRSEWRNMQCHVETLPDVMLFPIGVLCCCDHHKVDLTLDCTVKVCTHLIVFASVGVSFVTWFQAAQQVAGQNPRPSAWIPCWLELGGKLGTAWHLTAKSSRDLAIIYISHMMCLQY